MQYVGSCPIVCREERGRETDRDDDDDDASADGDREEDEDEDEVYIDDNYTDDHCFCREKRGDNGDQESDKKCPRNRRDAGCIWWSWRWPSFTTIFSISMFTGCPKKLTEKNLTMIECCGAKFSHKHELVALDPAVLKKRPKTIFPNIRGAG